MLSSDESGQIAVPVLLLIVLAGVIAAGIYMMDNLGLIDFQEEFYSRVQSVPVVGEYLVPGPVSQEQYQLDRLRQKETELEERQAKLDQRRESLEQRQQELEERANNLEQREQELADRETGLMNRQQQYDSRSARVEYLAELYGNMQPADAANRLQAIQQDDIIIRVLQNMENQGASILLANMDEDRAAVISRKMAQYPPEVPN